MLFYISLICLLLFSVNCIPSEFQSVQTAAKLARQVLKDAGIGTIMTLMENESDLNGYPFGIMEYYNENYFNNGNLLLYMSDLQLSAKNMHQHPNRLSFSIRATKEYNKPLYGNSTTPVEQPRFTLFGYVTLLDETDKAFECFTETHPEAKYWHKMHDFHFYQFHVQSIYYVGGFGGLNYIGWIPLRLYQQPHLILQSTF
ncbi:hypothetical protein G6F46_002411 [Rhizopus delemar]|uniref:CREG-like beta-barrel domain-containing protein n=1 Tax=Rhizopus oryzae TaxID=64495 RepID=A0A9P6YMD4_RHIOR|nr:hypothetical protein G6F43_000989 [Rhizopus delemar]KAG1552380.1 hypothetical protein G6F51_001261 [Rhizopus arrhizus]KAG1503198.1 hypothetical protein G6F54_001834 [Rhizopus delemar]KAG1559468.1 hypothetical protein G6F49_003568 [Rhizopus delemar]KAG1591010.1 hypothetical protein G6F48_003578 [Rhizopus delemar]